MRKIVTQQPSPNSKIRCAPPPIARLTTCLLTRDKLRLTKPSSKRGSRSRWHRRLSK